MDNKCSLVSLAYGVTLVGLLQTQRQPVCMYLLIPCSRSLLRPYKAFLKPAYFELLSLMQETGWDTEISSAYHCSKVSFNVYLVCIPTSNNKDTPKNYHMRSRGKGLIIVNALLLSVNLCNKPCVTVDQHKHLPWAWACRPTFAFLPGCKSARNQVPFLRNELYSFYMDVSNVHVSVLLRFVGHCRLRQKTPSLSMNEGYHL